jgi:ABC-type glycerol-3-phosphate transport system substrate-binding protein
MGYMKRIVSAGFIFAFILLVSCHPPNSLPDETATTGSSSVMLKFRITWADYSGRGEAIWKIVDSYNEKESDGTIISMVSGDEDLATIQSLLEKESETVFVLPYRYVKHFGQSGYLMDLTALFKDSEALFYPQVWQLGAVNDVTFGVPWLGHSMCLLYNKSLLNKAGVDPASITDLNKLENAMALVEEKTAAKGIGLVGADSNDISWMVNQFIYGFGSGLVSDDGKTVAVNNAMAKDALAYYKDVLGAHAQASWLEDTGIDVMTHFRNQEIAFEIQGIWGVTDIQKNGAPFDVGIIAMNDVGLSAEVGPMMLAVPSTMSDTNKEEAVKFIRYMISTQAQEKIMNGEYSPEHDTYYPFRTPIRMDMADSQIFKINPDYVKFIEGFQNPSIDMPVPAWQTIKDTLYQPGLHQVMLGEITIDAFLSKLETEGNKILREEK